MKKTLIALLSVALIACENTDKPVVNLLEVGSNNSKTATIGGELHLEAEMIADGKIANIRLVIHPEGEEEHGTGGLTNPLPQQSWEVDSTYTGVYANVRNTTFHEHIDIPLTASAGHYHLHLILTDQEGNQADAEVEIELVAPAATVKKQ